MGKYMYEYLDAVVGENQYKDIDFDESPVVDARYIKSTNEYDQDNPLIEALPPAMRIQDVIPATIRGYNREKIKDMSDDERMAEITKLKSWRFPLPFQQGLNAQFHKSLTLGYRFRKIKAIGLKEQEKIFVSPSISVTSDAFALLGCSGTGKSTAIENILKHYPQVIRHTFDDGTVFYQIVYVYVTCPSNSNVRTLLDNIARQIDMALGNTDYMYFNLVKKQKTIGDKASHLVDIIKAFGVGTIIIDEIQFINTTSSTESSYNSLLTLANEGGVRINVVGTEEAFDKIFGSSLKLNRRSGIMINADSYCADINFFATICRSLTSYQWFDDSVEFDDNMIITMYELTGGIIALLINLYAQIHTEYLQFPKDKRPKVTATFIRKVSEKTFVGLDKHLNGIKNNRAMIAMAKKELKINEHLEPPKERELIAEMTENTALVSVKFQNIVDNIKLTAKTTGLKVTQDEIYSWTEKIMAEAKYSASTEDEIASAVYKQLQKEHSRKGKAKKTKKNSDEHIEICNFLDNDVQTLEGFEKA